jgi:hypothetical protein
MLTINKIFIWFVIVEPLKLSFAEHALAY